MKFNTPLWMGRVRVIISCQKSMTPYTGVRGFFLSVNFFRFLDFNYFLLGFAQLCAVRSLSLLVLPPYSLRSQGDNIIQSQIWISGNSVSVIRDFVPKVLHFIWFIVIDSRYQMMQSDIGFIAIELNRWSIRAFESNGF